MTNSDNGKVIQLQLPLPPSANRYWRIYRGRAVISSEAKKYKEHVGWKCRERGITPIVENVRVTLDIYRARKAGDLDNFIKVGLDALQGHAIYNDNQIVSIVANRHDDKDNPRIEVMIEPVSDLHATADHPLIAVMLTHQAKKPTQRKKAKRTRQEQFYI
jgi:crossover junction endodeoxyribonuclease RusA